MAKSTTRKKLESEINELFLTIRTFAVNELYEMIRNDRDTVIFPVTENNLIVGRFNVALHSGLWRVTNYFDEVMHEFYNKTSAIYFCLAIINSKFHLADRLKNADIAFQAAKNEFGFYDQKVHSTTDDFKLHLYICKLEECKNRLRTSASEMEKSLKSAKYLNKSGT